MLDCLPPRNCRNIYFCGGIYRRRRFSHFKYRNTEKLIQRYALNIAALQCQTRASLQVGFVKLQEIKPKIETSVCQCFPALNKCAHFRLEEFVQIYPLKHDNKRFTHA